MCCGRIAVHVSIPNNYILLCFGRFAIIRIFKKISNWTPKISLKVRDIYVFLCDNSAKNWNFNKSLYKLKCLHSKFSIMFFLPNAWWNSIVFPNILFNNLKFYKTIIKINHYFSGNGITPKKSPKAPLETF